MMNNKNHPEDIFQRASKVLFKTNIDENHHSNIDQTMIKTILPQQDFLLLVDRITFIDQQENLIGAFYDLNNAQEIFAGHFPDFPIWPGIMQVEAVKQVATILFWIKHASPAHLATICQTRFINPISPEASVEIQVRLLNNTALGQCIHQNKICSAIWLELQRA